MSDFFKTLPLLKEPHLQTVYGHLFRPKYQMILKRDRMDLPDGDFLDLDWLEGASSNPTIIILHGLEGSSQSTYVQSFLYFVKQKSCTAVVMHGRACSGELNRRSETHHSGRSDDLDAVFKYVESKTTSSRICLMGFSIGGNILLKWLGSGVASQKLYKAAAISVPYNLEQCVQLMDKGINKFLYTRYLLNRLKKKVLQKVRLYPELLDWNKIKNVSSFDEFDGLVTAPLNGFENPSDYWRSSSCEKFLNKISIPTLLIHANDDPFFPGKYLPLSAIHESKNLHLIHTNEGGHVAFVDDFWPWRRKFWLEEQVFNFFDEKKSE